MPAVFTFDHAGAVINVTVADFTVQDLLTAIHTEEYTDTGMTRPSMIYAVNGKVDIAGDGSLLTDITLLLTYDIQFAAAGTPTRVIVSGGQVFKSDGSNAFLTAANVNITEIRSVAGTVVPTGSGLSTAQNDKLMALPDEDTIAAALLGAVIEGTITVQQAQRLMLSGLAGKASGAATDTMRFRDLADSKDRIVATVDADGNRLAVTLDGS